MAVLLATTWFRRFTVKAESLPSKKLTFLSSYVLYYNICSLIPDRYRVQLSNPSWKTTHIASSHWAKQTHLAISPSLFLRSIFQHTFSTVAWVHHHNRFIPYDVFCRAPTATFHHHYCLRINVTWPALTSQNHSWEICIFSIQLWCLFLDRGSWLTVFVVEQIDYIPLQDKVNEEFYCLSMLHYYF